VNHKGTTTVKQWFIDKVMESFWKMLFLQSSYRCQQHNPATDIAAATTTTTTTIISLPCQTQALKFYFIFSLCLLNSLTVLDYLQGSWSGKIYEESSVDVPISLVLFTEE
jgi:hypothetical protein